MNLLLARERFTLAAARGNLCRQFVVGDRLAPLCGIWHQIVTDPRTLAKEYADLWDRQLPDAVAFYNKIREEFNRDGRSSKLLFLLARCVKNAVRFNPSGQFNQSPDRRRLGTKPKTMAAEIEGAHRLLRDRCIVSCGDYEAILEVAGPEDIVYLDPPYQGTSEGRDSRYFKGVPRENIVSVLAKLNLRGVQFVLSYDGICGDKTYGSALPSTLGLKRLLVDAGRSSQATLNGRDHRTIESIYVSSGLFDAELPDLVTPSFVRQQEALFE